MKLLNQKCALAIIALLFFSGACLSACKANGNVPITDPISYRSTGIIGSFPQSGEAPLEVRVLAAVSLDERDYAAGKIEWVDAVTKIEVDFGDGTGWFDITLEQFDHYAKKIELIDMTPHVYNVPGPYYINTRATYWDGELVYSTGYLPYVTVLPAEES